MEEILYHIPGLRPGNLIRVSAQNAEQMESIAQSMCREVANKHFTKIAYFCGTGKSDELRQRFGIDNMTFVELKKRDIRWLSKKAGTLINRTFVRFVVVDSLETLLDKVPAEKMEGEKKRILAELCLWANYGGVPIVLLSDHPTEQPCLGGIDLFKDATILNEEE